MEQQIKVTREQLLNIALLVATENKDKHITVNTVRDYINKVPNLKESYDKASVELKMRLEARLVIEAISIQYKNKQQNFFIKK